MELKLNPYHKNSYPIRGLLIKAQSMRDWLQEIQAMGLSLESCRVYPIPHTAANSIWGCLVLPASGMKAIDTGKHERCQMLAPHMYIPEFSILHPPITDEEIQHLFSENKHILHPEFGWVELPVALDFSTLLAPVKESEVELIEAVDPVFIPKVIKSFQIKPLPPEEVMQNLETWVTPDKKDLEDEPLDLLEKGKLSLYEMLFKKEGGEHKEEEKKTEKTGFMKGLESLLSSAGVEGDWSEDMQEDYESLERRNQKQLDKLLDMLAKNPDEALKYAIPLDTDGTSRGKMYKGDLDWNLRWFDFSLFGNSGNSGGGGSIDLGDDLYRLEAQYRKTAKALIEKGDHKKAAFVYLKLLKDYYMAAQTLEQAEYYEEAASIYLQHMNNKAKAAECYEKGNMTLKAIEFYKELKNDEKVGDLYLKIHDREKADMYFLRVVEQYKADSRFLKASWVAREKMNQSRAAQELLLMGWRKDKKPTQCLGAYFSAITDPKELEASLKHIYAEEVHEKNQVNFLEVLKSVYKKEPDCADTMKEMAYEIVAKVIPTDKSVVASLRAFNMKDRELMKDTMRFNLKRK